MVFIMKGGITHDELYNMPIYLRNYYMDLLREKADLGAII